MTSGQVDLQNGSKGTFPGVLWQDQTSGGQIVDYEKCVYVFTLANAVDHAAANKMCETSLVQPTSGRFQSYSRANQWRISIRESIILS